MYGFLASQAQAQVPRAIPPKTNLSTLTCQCHVSAQEAQRRMLVGRAEQLAPRSIIVTFSLAAFDPAAQGP